MEWALRDYKTDGQIGIEKTIDEYISKLIAVFNECKRVLKKEGTCWIVLGDTYSVNSGTPKPHHVANSTVGSTKKCIRKKPRDFGIKNPMKEKSLCMIPERFAIKMIENGWILRNKIIWHKRNCMPSSAKDRFTIDYEYIYFFTKNKKYYFNTQYEPNLSVGAWSSNNKNGSPYEKNNPRIRPKTDYSSLGRIKRCVWTINTKPFSEAHFAVFPEELVKQCIDAGCPEKGIVLDCFMGSGTTALVALKHNRKFLGIELNEDYIKITQKRIEPYLLQSKIDMNI